MRSPSSLRSILCAAAMALVSAAAGAASSAASSASEGSSASVGSLSTSVEKSSASSTGGKKVAAGAYRVVAMAELAGRPGTLRVQLAAADGSGEGADDFVLLLPRAAAERGALAPGRAVAVSERPYGLEFAALDAGRAEAFFLVLDDAWHRELESRPVADRAAG